ncbi:hypothetical protein BDY19DRAFT_214418 [Irpex rosettiformis]|uniref:Uncharacterized protein n=1 Tax=Irpex rosettiformis TaxID=378272 RepID=A0ACB8U247_9APHY|nr:hypothetical protein BDY19DRAFT_214418 [Irpex rosettiformis]
MEAALKAALDKAMQERAWGEGEADEDGDFDEDDEYDAEAEEIAKRLGDQLWADIAKAQAEASASANPNNSVAGASMMNPRTTAGPLPGAALSTVVQSGVPTTSVAESSSTAASRQSKKQEAVLVTVRTILSFAFKDPVVRDALASHQVPNIGSSVLDMLTQCVSGEPITKTMAKPLSESIVSLAKSSVLFSSMRNSDAPAIQLDKGKRKRDTMDVDPISEDRYQKRPPGTVMVIEYPDILALMTQAVRTIVSAFSSAPDSIWRNGVPDSSFISSIQYHLHQVYLFSVTSSPRARHDQISLLQELGGLIQMLGVLSKIPIGPAPSPWESSNSSSLQPPPTDIGTAVYPCLVPGCLKTFHRLYSLRMHQRLHALVDRPYKCTSCPASFARNHDLKRHVKLHDKTAWKCLGCDKVFSRRDAIKRHKDSRSKAQGGKSGSSGSQGQADSACANAGIEQVEVEKTEDEEDATRRAKMWNGIVANQMANASAAAAEAQAQEGGIVPILHVENVLPDGLKGLEEGEIPQHIIEHAQATVLHLYPIIKGRVGPSRALAPTPVQSLPGAPHPTLASVIARTQPHYRSSESTPEATPLAEQQTPSSDNSLPLSWLTEEQTRLLEQAIAQAASAAQAQAEAEAALEEEEDDEDVGDEEDDAMDATAS